MSMLRPLLFLIDSNDIINSISLNLICVADDTNVYKSTAQSTDYVNTNEYIARINDLFILFRS